MRMLIYNYLELIAPLSVVVAFALSFRHWRRMRHLQLLFVHFLSSSLFLGVAVVLLVLTIPNTLWYNINGFTSLFFLSLFFHRIIQRKRTKAAVLWLCAAGLSAYTLLLLFKGDNGLFFSLGYSISSLLIIIYSLLFLNEVFRDALDVPVHDDSTVWIVSGLLTYYLSVYVIHVTYKWFTMYFVANGATFSFDRGTLWGIHNVIYFLTCALIVYCLVQGRNKSAA